MQAFAVRHKPTGEYIPRSNNNGRGGSYSEPCKDKPARLFHCRHAARSFLLMWLKGHFKNNHSLDYETGIDEYSLEIIPQPHRKKEDMEIVEFNLVEVLPSDNLVPQTQAV